ncbi:MAG: hypothetical protein UT48_C0001G0096 [Parcubacteria group bacterium GW2011_GWE2_39_37]|uniref:Uncharacterized protein n=1 Tax=Candidatus Falkowbacteria bacterium GW2011_GWF2_39_8 TaxID=1618642 RepID=A0A0G0SG67_9BACT|nr:MAG: hypothetical protein UT48_C0001G0096 [Parcubacteria group bacterium GW2011_GWE2_39_37]KKR33695.1 MAG: hypothetical protein UT64_C0004G0002 [Candidatus Falkowbacteria bacterium GW2011_GWF2_39_8]
MTIKKYRIIGRIGILVGLFGVPIVNFINLFIKEMGDLFTADQITLLKLFSALLAILIYAGFVYGCVAMMKAKGQPWALGLLGFFYIPGLLILIFFPDKNKVKT